MMLRGLNIICYFTYEKAVADVAKQAVIAKDEANFMVAFI